MRGYQSNPEANARAFTAGWFRTGDQGVLDRDGYLTLTGRLKEIINRGGEKVAPLEVDNVLSAHPAVAQALTFAMPHPRLGEEVAAAIVLRPGESAGEERDPGVRGRAPGRVQGAAPDRVPGRDPEGADRQAAADRARRAARAAGLRRAASAARRPVRARASAGAHRCGGKGSRPQRGRLPGPSPALYLKRERARSRGRGARRAG